ncbi:MAG: hypothetical protein FWG90_09025 [Oscillospiraceae bacterium]|nr:hypothetical protein [Oscillospiraceae bacterium]
MQAQAYEGYFKNGSFFTAGQTMRIPENRRIYITILDEPARDEAIVANEHAEAWQDFLDGIKSVDNEPLPEFERVTFREVDI